MKIYDLAENVGQVSDRQLPAPTASYKVNSNQPFSGMIKGASLSMDPCILSKKDTSGVVQNNAAAKRKSHHFV